MADRPKQQEVAAPIFVQSGKSEFPELDRWEQVGQDEARMTHDMTLRNELSGGTETVREFETRWRELCGCKYAVTTMNGTNLANMSYLLEIVPSHSRSTYLGFIYTLLAPLAFVSLGAGALAQWRGYPVVFYLSFLFAIGFWASAWRLVEPRARTAHASPTPQPAD